MTAFPIVTISFLKALQNGISFWSTLDRTLFKGKNQGVVSITRHLTALVNTWRTSKHCD